MATRRCRPLPGSSPQGRCMFSVALTSSSCIYIRYRRCAEPFRRPKAPDCFTQTPDRKTSTESTVPNGHELSCPFYRGTSRHKIAEKRVEQITNSRQCGQRIMAAAWETINVCEERLMRQFAIGILDLVSILSNISWGKSPASFVPPRPMPGEWNIPGSIAREECRFV